MPHYPTSLTTQTTRRPAYPANRAFGVCNLVDEQGREIQITEHMIMNACEALRRRCHLPQKS
jgi:hypothetical protein